MRLGTRGVWKLYNGRVVLRDISLDFKEGGVTVLLGPNGAGKTSLLRLLNLLEAPDRGEILIDGNAPGGGFFSGWRRERQRMGFVFQLPALLDGTVLENMAYPLRLRGRTLDTRAMEAVLSRVDLLGKREQAARVLSGGEKQRLQLARVMLLDPEVYLLDEPTSSLDPLSARDVERIIGSIARSGKTVILSTHNLLMARAIGDEFCFFRAGQLLQQGDGDSLFARPVSMDIAEYSAGVNILEGRIVHYERGCRFQTGDLVLEVSTAHGDGPASVFIRPEDIVLSREALRSSARNSLPGRVVSCQNLGIVKTVRVDVRGIILTVFLTPESVEGMKIEADSPVWLTCKATAVHVMAS